MQHLVSLFCEKRGSPCLLRLVIDPHSTPISLVINPRHSKDATGLIEFSGRVVGSWSTIEDFTRSVCLVKLDGGMRMGHGGKWWKVVGASTREVIVTSQVEQLAQKATKRTILLHTM